MLLSETGGNSKKQYKMKLSRSQRQVLFSKYNGKCAYCGCDLSKSWHADHIEPVVRNRRYDYDRQQWVFDGTYEKPENNHVDNFNPSCASCNIQKNSYTLEQFRENIQYFVNSLNSYSTQYKFAKKYGLIKETEVEVKFYFEKIEFVP